MHAKSLMVQGTTSDAGKTTLVTALCRILKSNGVNVVPFKPQNMALNSAVTVDGGEIGRAQALQAQAAGLPPHTDMNPILIKPTSDTRAQIIVHGKAVNNMEATNYHEYKTKAMEFVLESYNRLQSQYQVIIVEGAGSPAEINLRDRDIANMGFAENVDCPVIIIADIDRGGVFAHLIGTLELLSPSEQNRVVGFVINRFRGDIKLLQSGLDWLETRTGKPVLGVIPYILGLHLDAEDALTKSANVKKNTKVSVTALALPRISNHTDMDPIRLHPDVNFMWIGPNMHIAPCDLIVVPGSKNPCDDLDFLRDQGWDKDIQRHLRYGGKVLGLCGGFQMLGNTISDPYSVETSKSCTCGLKYFDMETTLAKEKALSRRDGVLWDKITPINGYEIHCGVSSGVALEQPFCYFKKDVDLIPDGAISEDNQIAGTYLHGIFDEPPALQKLLSWIGLETENEFNITKIREEQIDRLAKEVESSMNIAALNLF